MYLSVVGSHTLLRTAAVQCDFLNAPENGQVILRGTVVGSEAVYSCFPGFTLTGGDTRTCQESGEWSGQAPLCTGMQCSARV